MSERDQEQKPLAEQKFSSDLTGFGLDKTSADHFMSAFQSYGNTVNGSDIVVETVIGFNEDELTLGGTKRGVINVVHIVKGRDIPLPDVKSLGDLIRQDFTPDDYEKERRRLSRVYMDFVRSVRDIDLFVFNFEALDTTVKPYESSVKDGKRAQFVLKKDNSLQLAV